MPATGRLLKILVNLINWLTAEVLFVMFDGLAGLNKEISLIMNTAWIDEVIRAYASPHPAMQNINSWIYNSLRGHFI